ncbi:Hypothetical protein A7982_06204 [Minicystis rosea]|nr:Hypothetical protein A7982_06204 [Minicystis rosea]
MLGSDEGHPQRCGHRGLGLFADRRSSRARSSHALRCSAVGRARAQGGEERYTQQYETQR